jgi:7-carboxy-7-deazaguanine synthase (Cx14CxxC type)
MGGGKFRTAAALADKVAACWPDPADKAGKPFVVCTGGEPLLQLDEPLIDELHERGFEIAVETNGTQPAPEGLDWICVSPKADAELVVKKGNELKLVYRQEKAPPERFADLAFDHFFLQPMDGPEKTILTRQVVDYCKANPQWRLSVQTHKILGIP